MSTLPGVIAQADWSPGDPLYARGQYRSYGLFNYREDRDTDECLPCPDAASWPIPKASNRLPSTDEITAALERGVSDAVA